MQNFRSWYVQLPARTRQIVVVALALAVLITIIAVFQGGEPPKRRASEILCPWDNRSPPNGCIQ